MSNVPDMLKVIDGKYDEWVLPKKIVDGAEIADSVKTISCDTRDFALGWNFKRPEPYKKAECGRFMVCNSYWVPVKWRKIYDNLKKTILT